ncbi:hypothetical protein EST38_g11706 [Candolleomyces aberdarensis]|uniref:NACHT domain-containing protein n=1 Tax=Candolleomyces aberdarensis TaxID=2316362 RepID=A0A4Q2D470_9AGAR|nr:hypothetical protein EST38_g11706 [Candolleomyces aberdarensis]
MAIAIDGLAPNIDEAMKSYPTIFTKALPTQLEKLVIEPCKKLKSLASSRWLIVVDGLDECVGTAGSDREQEQELVLNILISLLSHSLPFSILLCSRAESWLKEAFKSEPLSWMTEPFSLHGSPSSDQDMLRYLVAEFERIASNPRNDQAMRCVERPWPPTHVPKLLVQKASGQFVYAKTAIRFIDDHWSPPPKQLNKLLASFKRSSDTKIFSAVDSLYNGILEACPNVEIMLQVLGEVMCLDYGASAHSDRWPLLDGLSTRSPGESYQALRGLHSVVDVENLRQPQPLFHPSFHDFLTSRSRSGGFYINTPSVHAQLLYKCIDCLDAQDRKSDRYLYAKLAWRPHLAEARLNKDLLRRLLSFDFFDWFTQEIKKVPEQHSWFLSLSDWAWGHGLFRLGQIQAFKAESTESDTLDRCMEHFQSDYDRSMVWSLDRLAKRGLLERFFDACFSTSLPGISMTMFKYEIPDSPPDYIPNLSFEGKALDVLPLKGVVEKLKLADPAQSVAGSAGSSMGTTNDNQDEFLDPPEFGVHFHAFSPEFLSFLADPNRSRHHCYITLERIRWLIHTMLTDHSGLPKILEKFGRYQSARSASVQKRREPSALKGIEWSGFTEYRPKAQMF